MWGMSKALTVLLELKDCSDYWSEYSVPIGIYERIDEAIQQLLAQPEQEPVEDRIAQWHWLGYEQGKKASKREPLSDNEISKGYTPRLHMTQHAFYDGVKWAEQQHGIGGGE
jgi:hypothetical protein